MASSMTSTTVTTANLSDGTNSTSSTNCIRGSAKAWVNFSGVSSTSIRASYNVSSVTYNSVGLYTVNFTSALADANYVTVVSMNAYAYNDAGDAYPQISGSTSPTGWQYNPTNYTSSGVQVVHGKSGSTRFDVAMACVACFR